MIQDFVKEHIKEYALYGVSYSDFLIKEYKTGSAQLVFLK